MRLKAHVRSDLRRASITLIGLLVAFEQGSTGFVRGQCGPHGKIAAPIYAGMYVQAIQFELLVCCKVRTLMKSARTISFYRHTQGNGLTVNVPDYHSLRHAVVAPRNDALLPSGMSCRIMLLKCTENLPASRPLAAPRKQPSLHHAMTRSPAVLRNMAVLLCEGDNFGRSQRVTIG